MIPPPGGEEVGESLRLTGEPVDVTEFKMNGIALQAGQERVPLVCGN
jgi:hypothetical protein